MTTAVYVSNADSGDVWVYHLDPQRAELSPVQRVMVGGQVMPLALDPSKRFLYAARRSDPLEVLSFSIDPLNGELGAIGAAPLPHSMANIATDRSGRWLLGASYGGDQIAVSPIGADGAVRAAQQVLATPPHAHAIHADPSNCFVFATSLGGGAMLQFRFDETTGQLTPNAPAALVPHEGASPRHFVFGRDGRFVYLLNELDAKIDVLAFDRSAGTLRALQTIASLPPGFEGEPWAADLHLTPDGRFLYSSERRSSTLAAFRVDAASGELAPIGRTPTEAQPRGFAITPDGRHLIAAGQRSHHLSVYAIDAASGALLKRTECTTGQNPNWIEVVEMNL
jgi:6-phosphogluconolactonase